MFIGLQQIFTFLGGVGCPQLTGQVALPPQKPNTPVLIPAVTQPKQRRGYFLMPEGKQQRQQGQQAKQVDATNQQGSFQRTQDRPQALLTGQLGGLPPRDGQQPVGAAARGYGPACGGAAARYCRAQCHSYRPRCGRHPQKGSLCFIFHTGGTQHSGRVPPHAAAALRSCSARSHRGSGYGTCSPWAGWPGTEWSPAAQCARGEWSGPG